MAPVGVKMAANLFSFVRDLGLCKTQHLALLPAFQIFLRKKLYAHVSRFKIVKSHYELFADLGSIRKKSETRRGTSLLIIIDNLIRNPFLLASRVPPLVCIEHTTSTIDPTCRRACPIGIDLATWNETMHATDPFLPAIAYSLGKRCMRLFNSRRWASPRASIDGIFILFEFEFGLMIRRAVRIIRGEYLVSLIVVTERDDMVDGAKSLETRLKYCRISLKTAASTRRRIMTLFPAVNSCQRRRAFRQ